MDVQTGSGRPVLEEQLTTTLNDNAIQYLLVSYRSHCGLISRLITRMHVKETKVIDD